MLRNHIYLGNMYKKNTEKSGEVFYTIIAKNSHEPLVTQDKFEKVQRILKKNKSSTEHKRYFYIFKGVLFCPECHVRLTGINKKYICPRGCGFSGYQKYIEPQLLNYLMNLENQTKHKQHNYEERIKKIKVEQENLEIQYATIKISKERYEERLFKLNEEMKEAYNYYMSSSIKDASYYDLIKENQLDKLKEVMLERNLKIEIGKENSNTFHFWLLK